MSDDESRHDSLRWTESPAGHSSLWEWTRHRNPVRVMVNYAVIVFCRICPSLRAKNWLYRRLGMHVGRRVAWGLEATPDVFWPEQIVVEDDVIIGYDATILCHEFLQDGLRTGPVVLGERSMIGAGAIVLPGVTIGADARVAANSLVAHDVPAGETVAGVPAKPVERS